VEASDWDARYSGTDLVWGAEPNRFVAAELSGLAPGKALDVACGEGRNAIWLASQGWEAIGVDFSSKGLERAASLAQLAGVASHVEWVTADVVTAPFPPGPFDAVVVAYLQLRAPGRRSVIRKAAQVLAADGLLVVVGHDRTNLAEGAGGPQDPEVLFSPEDVQADLEGLSDIKIQRAHRVQRPVSTSDGERNAIDALVVARRTAR
jgi:SAM-dependent methyltransferase